MNIADLKKQIKNKRAGTYAPMYLYGTENMAAYYPKVKVKGKAVLTIAGSGDQILNAYFFEAKSVVGVDLNKLSQHVVQLKFAAAKMLSYKDFLSYFGDTKPGSLNHKLYKSFRSQMKKSSRDFFDQLYKHFKNDGKKLMLSVFFNQRNVNPNRINAYLKNESAYKHLQHILEKQSLQFIQQDVQTISTKFSKKFDVINLSNVPNFLVHIIWGTPYNWDKKLTDLLIQLRALLKPKGKLFFYQYSGMIYPNSVATYVPYLSLAKERKRLKKSKKFSYSEFRVRGVFKGNDVVVVLSKNN